MEPPHCSDVLRLAAALSPSELANSAGVAKSVIRPYETHGGSRRCSSFSD